MLINYFICYEKKILQKVEEIILPAWSGIQQFYSSQIV